ncbi:MAG TPA: serine/threonine-protein kinase [Ktedonobacteraceae bacterium]
MAENATLGNYRVLRLIGDGGFARVYLGEHLYLKTYAAIKVPKLQLDASDLEDFLNEARRGIGLRHPNVLRALECGVESGTQPYIVMEYAPGGSVRTRYPSGTSLPPLAIITYAKQAGAGLQYIHDQGLIHLDIKPGNMMLGSNDELLLGDFGIAIVAHRTATQSMSDASGTARYMSPEQFMGRARPASDQYALAVVIYEWICGSSPFNGNIAELYYKHTHVAPPPLHVKAPNIVPAVEQVILRALAKDPRDRFPNVQDFVSALEQAGRPGSTSTMQRVSGPISIPIPTPTPAPLPPMPRVEEDIPTIQTQQPLRAQRPRQEASRPLMGVEFSAPANETIIPTIISQRNVSSPGVGVSPTIPAHRTDTPGAIPSYQVAPPVPPQSQRSGGRNPNQRMVILLVPLVIILLGGIIGFYIVSNRPTHSNGGSTPTATRTNKTLTLTTPPSYSSMFGFNTRHTHFIPDETTLNTSNVAGLTLAWKTLTSSSGEVRSSPIIANGIVYITSSDNNLYAFNASSGAPLWHVSTGNYVNGLGSFIYSSPAIVNGVLYIGSNDHRVYAFNALSGGKPIWISAPTGGPIYSSPAVVNNMVYIGSTDHKVYAYNAANGSLVWSASTGDFVFSSPAVVNNVVYIGSDDSKLYALDASTGRVLWEGIAGGHIDSSPTVVDGMVYLGSADGRIYAFDATGCQGQATCQPVWTTSTGGFIDASPAVASAILYIGSNDKTLYAYDTNRCLNTAPNTSCPSLWTWTAPAQTAQPFESSPTVANGVLYIGSEDGNLYAYSAQSGTKLWSYPTGGKIISSPIVLNGMVYVGSTDHYLYAFHL